MRDCVTACTCVQKAQVSQGRLADLVGRRPPSLTHSLTHSSSSVFTTVSTCGERVPLTGYGDVQSSEVHSGIVHDFWCQHEKLDKKMVLLFVTTSTVTSATSCTRWAMWHSSSQPASLDFWLCVQ